MNNFKIQQPTERVTDSSRSTLGYTFLGVTKFSIDETQEKYFFNNPNCLGPTTFKMFFLYLKKFSI